MNLKRLRLNSGLSLIEINCIFLFIRYHRLSEQFKVLYKHELTQDYEERAMK